MFGEGENRNAWPHAQKPLTNSPQPGQPVECEDNDQAEVTVSRPLLDKYKQTLASFIDGARDFCNCRGMNYLKTSTDTPVDKLVASYLRKRGLVR